MDDDEKEATETAVMELDAQIYDTLPHLESAIVQRDFEEFDGNASDVEGLAEEILEIAESEDLDLWPRYARIIIEKSESMRKAFRDQEYERAFKLADRIYGLSTYELLQRDLYEEKSDPKSSRNST